MSKKGAGTMMVTRRKKLAEQHKKTAIKYLFSLGFLVVATLVISFGSRTPTANSILPEDDYDTTPSTTVGTQLKEAENNWALAHLQQNPQPLRPLLAGDFVATDATGTTRGSAAYLRTLGKGKPTDLKTSTAPASLDIRIYGRVAVVTGQSKLSGKKERFIHVYRHQGMGWRMVASQATYSKG